MKKRFDDKALKLHGSGLRGFRAVCSIQVNQPLLHRWTWWNCIDCRIIYLFLLFYSHFFFSLSRMEHQKKSLVKPLHNFFEFILQFRSQFQGLFGFDSLGFIPLQQKAFQFMKMERKKKTRITYNNFSESQRILEELKASVIQSGSESANRSQP